MFIQKLNIKLTECALVPFHFNNTFSRYLMRDFSIFNILTLTPPTVYIIHSKTNWIYSRVVKEAGGGYLSGIMPMFFKLS